MVAPDRQKKKSPILVRWSGCPPHALLPATPAHMARSFARKEAARLLTLREQGPESCPVCKPAPKSRLKRAIAAGLREALFPACDPCEEQRRRPEKDELQRDPQQRPQQQPRPIHTRGSVAERVAAVVIAKGEGGADAHADPTRSSFTLWELRKDGPRNECDYRVYLDERYRSQPYVMEKVPCVSKDSEIDILGRRYAVHLPDAPRYSPAL